MISLIAALVLGLSGLSEACPASMSDGLTATGPTEGGAYLIQLVRDGDRTTALCAGRIAEKAAGELDGLDARYFTVAHAVALQHLGRPADAIVLMKPLVGFQHHTVSNPSDFHAVLSEAYAAAGRLPEAEGQRRLALASIESDPPFALTPDQIRDLPEMRLTVPVIAIAPATLSPICWTRVR